MAVATVASFDADLRARGLLKRDTQLPRTISAETQGVQAGIRKLVGFWENVTSSHGFKTGARSWKRAAGENGQGVGRLRQCTNGKVVPRELLRPYRTAGLEDSPPSYEECTQDVPPDYTVSVAHSESNS